MNAVTAPVKRRPVAARLTWSDGMLPLALISRSPTRQEVSNQQKRYDKNGPEPAVLGAGIQVCSTMRNTLFVVLAVSGSDYRNR
jgi:hypothetical protein